MVREEQLVLKDGPRPCPELVAFGRDRLPGSKKFWRRACRCWELEQAAVDLIR
jgi:hypothetical protein